MKQMPSSIWHSMALMLCVLVTATGCSSAPKSVGVPLVGVNYTDFDYSMSVHDLSDASNRVSSGELTPFSAGGQMCCFTLPPNWRPGMKVRVRSLKGVSENGVWVRDDVTEQVIELPRYAGDELGTLWVLQLPNGRVEVLNSSVGPEHPQWSGAVKGWPQPSLAYRTKIWCIRMGRTLDDIELYKDLLSQLTSDPSRRAVNAWNHAAKYRPDEISRFDGPHDPRFIAHLLHEYETGLKRSELAVKRLKSEEPK